VRSRKWLARAGGFAAANFAAIYAPHSSLLRAFLEGALLRALLEGASLAALTNEPLLATSCARR
jgi:hypothetical protein